MKKTHHLLILFAIFALTFGIRAYWLTQKNGFHVDEGLSVTLACYNDYMWWSHYEFNREYMGKELKEKSLVSSASFRTAFGDLLRLRVDQRDYAQTNFHYSLVRLSLAGIKTGDIRHITFRVGILHLILFSISFVFFFKLVKLLFPKSKLLQYSTTACAFLISASVTNTIYLRSYQLQETLFIVFCYYLIKTIDQKKHIIVENRLYIGRMILIISSVTALTLLTGYYALIFVGLMGLHVIYMNLKAKNYGEIKFYFLAMCLALLLAQAFCPQYLSPRSVQMAQNLSGSLFANIKISLYTVVSLLQIHFFTRQVIAICVMCLAYILLRKRNLQIQKSALSIFIVSALFFVIILIVAPMKVLRYVMPVAPFFALFPALIVNAMEPARKVSAAAMLLLCLCFLADATNENKIEHLYRHKPAEYIFADSPNIPVFIMNSSPWKYANLIPYLNDEQSYYFITGYDDILQTRYREFYLVVENIPEIINMGPPRGEIQKLFAMTGGEPETHAPYFLGARVSMADSVELAEGE
jgi:hypothetical protein